MYRSFRRGMLYPICPRGSPISEENAHGRIHKPLRHPYTRKNRNEGSLVYLGKPEGLVYLGTGSRILVGSQGNRGSTEGWLHKGVSQKDVLASLRCIPEEESQPHQGVSPEKDQVVEAP